MKRKILAVVLTLAMVVCYMPTMAFAAGPHIVGNEHPGDPCSCVASTKNGEIITHYETFEEVAAQLNSTPSTTEIEITLLNKDGKAYVNPKTEHPCEASIVFDAGESKTTTIYFEKFADAIYSVTELNPESDSWATDKATTVKLIKDIAIESMIEIPVGDKIILDSNKKVITSKVNGSESKLFKVNANSEFTFSGDGTVSCGDVNGEVSFEVGGKLVIKSGTFYSKSTEFINVTTEDSSKGNGTVEIVSEGTKDTKIQSGDSEGTPVAIKAAGKAVIVIGNSNDSKGIIIEDFSNAIQASGDSDISIKGGSFLSKNYDISSTSAGKLLIEKGDFSNKISATGSGAKVEISGGTFASDVVGSSLKITGGTFDYNFAINGTGDERIKGGSFAVTPSGINSDYKAKKIGKYYVICAKVEIEAGTLDKVYDGFAVAPAPVAKFNAVKVSDNAAINFVYTWYKRTPGEGESETKTPNYGSADSRVTVPPVNAGLYAVVIDIDPSNTKYISKDESPEQHPFYFEIKKAKAWLAPNDVTVKIGAEAPTLSVKSMKSDGSAFSTTETAYTDFTKQLAEKGIVIKDEKNNTVELKDAVKTVGTYTMTLDQSKVTATKLAAVAANYDLTYNKIYDEDNSEFKDGVGTLSVVPKDASTYGFNLGNSKSKNGVVALADGVITKDTIGVITAKSSTAVELVLDATLIDPEADTVQIPMEQAKALSDYISAEETKSEAFGIKFVFNGAEIALDNAAFNYIYKNADSQTKEADYIEVSAEVIEAADVNKNNTLKGYLEDVEGVNKVLDLNINSMKTKTGTETADSVVKAFDSLGGGKATVTTPLKTADNKKGSDYSVYYIDTTEDEVALTDMEADFTKAANTQTPAPAYEEGTLEFETNHFSYYVVCETIKSKECDGKADCPSYNFLDLEIYDDPGVWYHPYIDYVVENKIMNGMNSYTFEPKGVVTRAMVVKMIYEMEGQPSNYGPLTPFSDIDAEQWYFKALRWAYNNEIIKGIDDTHFGPNQPVTREQLATILYRYYTDVLGKTAEKATTAEMNQFADIAKVSAYAEDAMKWAVKAKIYEGEKSGANTNLKPGDGTLRQEIAKMFTVFDRDIIKAKKN